MSETPVIDAVAACELRVLDGRARGASAALERRRWVEVGYALSSDLVIRDPAAKGVRLRLRPREDSAELDLIEGEVVLLGHPLSAPATAILPAYVPLILGESAVAFGEPDSSRWGDAGRLLAAARADVEPASADAAVEAEAAEADGRLPAWQVISPALTRMSRFQAILPVAAGALVAVLVALVGWNTVAGWLGGAPSPDRATRILARDGFPGLKVEPADTGLVARGLLARSSDLTRLRDDVARRNWPMALAVQTGDQLRQGVADVLRTNGYEAVVKTLGPGLIAAEVRGGDPSRLEEVRKEALRDNPGLKQLVINGAADDAPRSLVPSDPNKRVVAVVGGDMGYVQTADGSRYFVGATLPTGHKITAIDDQDVTLALDGKTTHLKF